MPTMTVLILASRNESKRKSEKEDKSSAEEHAGDDNEESVRAPEYYIDNSPRRRLL